MNLAKNTFRCCSTRCGRQGNALDLWVQYTGLPLYQASLRLADELHLEIKPNREEATRSTAPPSSAGLSHSPRKTWASSRPTHLTFIGTSDPVTPLSNQYGR